MRLTGAPRKLIERKIPGTHVNDIPGSSGRILYSRGYGTDEFVGRLCERATNQKASDTDALQFLRPLCRSRKALESA
jgi:hypothetical protein